MNLKILIYMLLLCISILQCKGNEEELEEMNEEELKQLLQEEKYVITLFSKSYFLLIN